MNPWDKMIHGLLFGFLGLFISTIGMSQINIEKELNRIVLQSARADNSYLDSLFNLKENEPTSKEDVRIDKVLDRYELLTTSLVIEKISKVYSDGRPIVKSIRNRSTQITYWNQFHENGKLKWTGYTSGYMLPIGKWEEFDENGQFLSVIDQEADRINFVDIHKKAKDLNIIDHDLDFNYSNEVETWTIKDWNAKKRYLIGKHLEIRIEDFK
jgi:hypothetical protein